MKVRKYGSGGGGSIGRVKFSTDVKRNGEAGGWRDRWQCREQELGQT